MAATSSELNEARRANNEFGKTCGDRNAFFQLENWYPLVKDFTFGMTVIPLSRDESRVLASYHEVSKMLRMQEDFEIQQTRDPNAPFGTNWDSKRFQRLEAAIAKHISEEQVQLLNHLLTQLDSVIASYGGAAFVKLSTRSPKDAVFFGEPVKEHLRQILGQSTVPAGTPEAEEEDIIAFIRAISFALRVSCGHEALTLLTRSERAFQDLLLADLMNDNDRDRFSLSLVVRPWVNIDPEFEFRAFVSEGRLTACTQYYPNCFVSSIAARRDVIKQKIFSFWNEEIRPLIPASQPNYTIDFVLSTDLEKITIVELNNPPPLAGTSLYNWEDSADREEILHGSEFRLRVLTQVPASPKSSIHPVLANMIRHLRGEHDQTTSPALIRCNQCQNSPDSGVWYFCKKCGDYELCEDCYPQRESHHPVHSDWAQARCPSWIEAHAPQPSLCSLQ